MVKGAKDKLVVWVSSGSENEFHLASYEVVGCQLKLAIQKTKCDSGLTYRLADFPSLKPASDVIYFEWEASVGLRSLDDVGFGDSDHYFSVSNTIQEGETILEHSAGELKQIGDANRIADLQGRWIANKISLDGEELVLTDSFKFCLQGTHCVQLGTSVLTSESDKSVRIFARRNQQNGLLVIKSNGWDQPICYVGAFFLRDGVLHLALRRLGEDNNSLRPLPGKGILYAKLRAQDSSLDPIQLQFIGSESTPTNGTLHLFDARNSSQDTAYRITRLECDTDYGRHFRQVDRLETQIILKPGEVRRIEVPVSSSDSDWRVWIRGGPADEITPEKWTPVIGFFANADKTSQGISKTELPLAIGPPKKPMLRDLFLRNGPTTHDQLAKFLNQIDDKGEVRKRAFSFLNDVFARNIDQANRLADSPDVSRLLREAIYPLITATSAPKIETCSVDGNEAYAYYHESAAKGT